MAETAITEFVPVLGSASMELASGLSGALVTEGARELLDEESNVRSYIDRLLRAGLGIDALQCVTRSLPRVYAVSWGIGSVRRSIDDGSVAASETDRAGLALAERWLEDPSEENRGAAQEFAERDEFRSVGGWLAAAVAWTGGSLAPPECEVVPPPEHMPGDAISAALVALATRPPATVSLLSEWVADALLSFGQSPEDS